MTEVKEQDRFAQVQNVRRFDYIDMTLSTETNMDESEIKEENSKVKEIKRSNYIDMSVGIATLMTEAKAQERFGKEENVRGIDCTNITLPFENMMETKGKEIKSNHRGEHSHYIDMSVSIKPRTGDCKMQERSGQEQSEIRNDFSGKCSPVTADTIGNEIPDINCQKRKVKHSNYEDMYLPNKTEAAEISKSQINPDLKSDDILNASSDEITLDMDQATPPLPPRSRYRISNFDINVCTNSQYVKVVACKRHVLRSV